MIFNQSLSGSIDFVGRQSLLASLKQHWNEAREGRGSVLFIMGEGGGGKTRLVHHFVQHHISFDFFFIKNIAYDALSGVVYAPVVEGFGQFLRNQNPSTQKQFLKGLDNLKQLFPDLFPNEPQTSKIEDLEKTKLFSCFSRLVERISRKKPCVLILDDLHWADSATIDLFHYLIQGLHNTRVLLLVTFREKEFRSLPHLAKGILSLERVGWVQRLTLPPLVRKEVAQFFTHYIGGPPSVALQNLLVEKTKGNLLFLSALLETLQEKQGLYFDGQSWHISGKEIPLPETMLELVQSQLDELEPEPRRLLSYLSVVDKGTPHHLLYRVTGYSEEHLLSLIEHLIRLRFIEEVIREGELLYQWRHPLIRQGVYLTLPLTLRQLIHSQFATLVEANVKNLYYIANHYCGMEVSKATIQNLKVLHQAGTQAHLSGAFHEATRYLTVSLRIARNVEATDLTPRLEEQLGELHGLQGDFQSAQEFLQQANKAYQKQGNVLGVARIHRLISKVKWKLLDFQAALNHVEQGLSLLHPAKQQEEWERLQSERLTFLDRLHDAEKLKELHNTLEQIEVKASTHFQVAIGVSELGILLREGKHSQASIKVASLLEQVAQSNDWHQLLRVRNFAGLTAVAQGDFKTSEQHVQANLTLVKKHNLSTIEPSVLAVGAMSAYLQGDWDLAHQRLKRGIFVSNRIGLRRYHARLYGIRGFLYAYQGEFDLACKSIAYAHKIIQSRMDDIPAAASLWLPEGFLAEQQDDFASAERALAHLPTNKRGFGVDSSVPVLFLQCWGFIYLGLGQLDQLQKLINALRDCDSQTGYTSGWGAYFEGALCAQQGHKERALTHYNTALQTFEVLAVPFDRARAELGWLEVMVSMENFCPNDRFIERMKHCHLSFQKLKAKRFLQKVETLLEELPFSPENLVQTSQKTEEHVQRQLSPREYEVAEGILKGLSNKEIANTLNISHHTVSTHLKRIYKRLGVHSRLELHRYSQRESQKKV